MKNDYFQIFNERIKSVKDDEDKKRLFRSYRLRLQIMQNERLIHFLVTMTVIIVSVMCFVFSYITKIFIFYIITLVLLVMLAAYMLHYYRMENEVQKFETLADEFIKS